jgi:hypothetical protein
MPRVATFSLLLALAACGGKGTDTAGTDTGGSTQDSADTGADSTGLPENPAPFDVVVSGAVNTTLTFDLPTCTRNGQNFRTFWRNSARTHVYVLIAEVMGTFTGEGSYDQDAGGRVKLQEEAGGTLAYYAADPSQGDTLRIDVPYVLDTEAAGTFTVSGLHGTDGTITVTPTELPIWCPQFD